MTPTPEELKALVERLREWAKDYTTTTTDEAMIVEAADALDQIAAQQESTEPVAVVDANDDGYWADILPDRSVKVGQKLYLHPDPEVAKLRAELEALRRYTHTTKGN